MGLDKITLQNMKFYAYHGCEEFEKKNGQEFAVDLDIMVDASKSGQTDSLADAVNYAAVFEQVKCIVETERYNLLERLAHRISDQVLTETAIHSVTVRIRKPAVPLAGLLDWVQIEITRERNS